MFTLAKPAVHNAIFGLMISTHYKPTDCKSILFIDSHNDRTNQYLEPLLQQAVVISGKKPNTPFYSEESRTIYEIPEGAEVTGIEVCEGVYHPNQAETVDILVMLITHTGSESPLQHILCRLRK